MGDTVTIHPSANGADIKAAAPVRLQDRVPLDAIMADARKARPGRAIQGLLGFILFNTAYVAAKAAGVLFLSGAWCFSAMKMGWRTARGEPLDQPDLEEVLLENRRLRLELERVT